MMARRSFLSAAGACLAVLAARLARCDKLFGISGMTPQLLAIAVRMLHEAHVYPVRRGGRGRPSEPMRGTLVGFYQIFYGGSLKLERGEAHRRTAAICSAFFQEPINAATVRLRLSALRARWRKLIRGGRWPRGEYPVV